MQLLDYTAIAKIIILILNPIIASLALLVVAKFVIQRLLADDRTRAATRKALISAGVIAALYAVYDTALAYHRIHYSFGIVDHPVVIKTIPVPSSIVLVNMRCDQSCLERLVAGVHSEVFFISTVEYERNVRTQIKPPYPTMRYAITHAAPNACPLDTENKLGKQWGTSLLVALWAKGICPTVESVIAPEEGIFIVRESMRRVSKEAATDFKTQFLVTKPPSPLSYFDGIEVQRRSKSGVEVLAHAEAYEAPSILGIPPLIGCWERPDNVLFILPPGDTGCGLWRWITASYNQDGSLFDGKWIYSQAFSRP